MVPDEHLISERVRLTIESGILCLSWSGFHEKAEELLGHPIWIHEFADADTNLTLKVAVAALDEDHTYYLLQDERPIESLVRMIA